MADGKGTGLKTGRPGAILITLLLSAILMVPVLFSGCANRQLPAESGSNEKLELNVSAALGLKDALAEIQQEYEKLHPNVKIVYNLAAAGVLRSQIEQGSQADIFISAAQKPVDDLQKKGLINPATLRNIITDKLVVIIPADSTLNISNFKDLAQDGVKKIGMGTPETVPAGQYARETLDFLGIWENVKDKMVLTKDVKTIVSYVETGNIDAGMVFSAVAATSDKVRVVAAAADNWHEPIVFPGVVLTNAKHPAAAEEFLNFVSGPEGMEIFKKHGFSGI